jgi:hypothetical protein
VVPISDTKLAAEQLDLVGNPTSSDCRVNEVIAIKSSELIFLAYIESVEHHSFI